VTERTNRLFGPTLTPKAMQYARTRCLAESQSMLQFCTVCRVYGLRAKIGVCVLHFCPNFVNFWKASSYPT